MEQRVWPVEVEAEEHRAPHAGEAVGTSGDVGGLERDRKDHLREREREHEEEDARGANGDRADREREQR
jgi:hypothetical protein